MPLTTSSSRPLRPALGANHQLGALAALFLRLGFTAFGGPAAHIAMMEDEVVRRRGWLSREDFLDLLGATNLIPGPNSTEMAIHIGHRRAGFAGLLVAGVCFIAPAVLIVTAIAWAYTRYGALPQARAILYGVKPVIIAIVLQALWRLGRTAIKSVPLAALAAAAVAGAALGVNELLVLLVAGVLAAACTPRGPSAGRRADGSVADPSKPREPAGAPAPALDHLCGLCGSAALPLRGWRSGLPLVLPAAVGPTAPLLPLFLIFLKIGAVLFGSGYVLLAFLRTDLVEHRHWLTESQLLDAVAVGQFTPGPVFTTATFIGFILAGPAGAAAATAGIFLPAFIFVALSGPVVPRLRRSRTAGGFLDGVNAASLALMALVTAQLGRSALIDVPTVLLAAAAAVVVFRWRINSAWLVLAGGLFGLAASAVHR